MQLDAETERPARRAKKKPRSGAVALAAERGDLETMRVLLRLEASGTAERWLVAKRAELAGLREQAEAKRGAGDAAEGKRLASQAQRLAQDVEAAEAAAAADFDAAAAAASCNAARQPALHCAVAAGHEAVVAALLEAGALITARNRAKRTALHLAAQSSSCAPSLIEMLLACPGVPCNAMDSVGSSALHYAAGRNNAALVQQLVAAGARVDLANKQLNTSLHVAAAAGAADAAEALLAASANINALDSSRRTPLHLAARDGRSATVELLLQAGADRSLLDRTGASFATHAQPHIMSTIYGAEGGAPETDKKTDEALAQAPVAASPAGRLAGWLGAPPERISARAGPVRDRQMAAWLLAAAQASLLMFLVAAGASFMLWEMGGPGNSTVTASTQEL